MMGWLLNFLSSRSFRVYFEGEESSEKNSNSGVPQGSILSPLLFNILMSDLPISEGVNMSVYADDVSLYVIDEDPVVAMHRLEGHIRQLKSWAVEWGQEFNSEKKLKLCYLIKVQASHITINLI